MPKKPGLFRRMLGAEEPPPRGGSSVKTSDSAASTAPASPPNESSALPKQVAPRDESQPIVGDEVQLRAFAGKYSAGTRGRVVRVYPGGLFVEFSDEDGRTERLDLPLDKISTV